jgi:hypothetical protein
MTCWGLGNWNDHDSAMFPPAIRPCLSPPKVLNIGTVRTSGRMILPFCMASPFCFWFSQPKLLGRSAILANGVEPKVPAEAISGDD